MKNYKKYLDIINLKIKKIINQKPNNLREMLTHSIDGGKRLRSIIPIIIGNKINSEIDFLIHLLCLTVL